MWHQKQNVCSVQHDHKREEAGVAGWILRDATAENMTCAASSSEKCCAKEERVVNRAMWLALKPGEEKGESGPFEQNLLTGSTPPCLVTSNACTRTQAAYVCMGAPPWAKGNFKYWLSCDLQLLPWYEVWMAYASDFWPLVTNISNFNNGACYLILTRTFHQCLVPLGA